jgi:hypothetical protein
MKTTEKPTVTNNPTEKGNNDHTSKPKNPNNDPDQTPEKEVKNPPKSDPKQNEPGKEEHKIGFNTNK